MIIIDGSQGEGGGQILRSALSLSAISNQATHIKSIRASRPKPGLSPQHLQAVKATGAVCKAEIQGAKLHSKSLIFQPSHLRSGRYKYNIGTAGATTLVLQTLFLPLSLANAASTVIITGGTHVPWSPSYHYLDLHWLPFMRQIGFDAKLSLDLAGFYPQGGGRISATVRPAKTIKPLVLTQRGDLLRITGVSAVSNLKNSIAERQKRQALNRLREISWGVKQPQIQIKTIRMPSKYKGTLLLLMAEFDSGRCCYCGLGELGKPAERVADEAVDAIIAFMDTDGTVDQYIADQLLLPLSLANGISRIRTNKITQHLLTNAEVLRSFLEIEIEIQGHLNEPGLIRITPLN